MLADIETGNHEIQGGDRILVMEDLGRKWWNVNVRGVESNFQRRKMETDEISGGDRIFATKK